MMSLFKYLLIFLLFRSSLYGQVDLVNNRNLNLLFDGNYSEAIKQFNQKERVLIGAIGDNNLKLFENYLLKAECYMQAALIENFKSANDSAQLYLNKYSPNETIYQAEIETNKCRYLHYHTIAVPAHDAGEKARSIYLRHKRDGDKIRAFLIYQSLASANRNYGEQKNVVFPNFDTALTLYNQYYKTPTYYLALLHRSLANACIDKCRKIDNAFDSNFITLAENHLNQAISILQQTHLKNLHDVAYLYALKGLLFYYTNNYKVSSANYIIAENKMALLKQKTNTDFLEHTSLYLTIHNWHNWTLDSLYKGKRSIKVLKERLLAYEDAEELFDRYAKHNVFKNNKSFREIYAISPYAALVELTYDYYEITKDTLAKYKLLQLFEKSKSWNYINEAISINSEWKSQTRIGDLKTGMAIKTQMQQTLTNEKAIICYYEVDKLPVINFYAAIITKNKFEVLKLKNKNHEGVEIFLNKIKLHEQNKIDYLNKFYRLYLLLFKNIENVLPNTIKDICIIPTGNINKISFDAMISDTTEKNYRKMPYLFNKYNFHYLQSWKLYQNSRKTIKSDDNSVFLSPTYHYKYFSDLPIIGNIIKKWCGRLNGTLLNTDISSKQKIIHSLETANIIHINGHTQFSLKDGVYFKFKLHDDTLNNSNQVITSTDIANLKTNADLVVFTSCESGEENLPRISYPISMAHLFNYSGAKSVIYSSVKLDEKTTAKVIDLFYENITNGDEKHTALYKAKKQYLHECKTSDEAYPLFWSALCLTGDVRPLFEATTNYDYLWFMLIPVGLCITILLSLSLGRRKQSKT